jgi:DNA-binding CsgD family transcriptional regulator
MGTQPAFSSRISLNGVEPGIADLIRSLASRAEVVTDGCTPSPACSETEEILFDVDVDGARYLLVRLPVPDRPQVQLSPREQEIVRMVAQGHPNKIIADVLSISTWTVCTHLRRIFAKAGVGSRAAMVARLFEGRSGRSDAQHPGSPGTSRPLKRAL